MTRLLFLIVCLVALQSCSDFHSPESRHHTTFYLRDSTEVKGELLAALHDSLFVLRSDLGEFDSQRMVKSIHFQALEFVLFRNDASAVLNGLGGMLGGALLGGAGGALLGSLSDNGGHGGGLGGLIGAGFGVGIGLVTGLVLGICLGLNRLVEIDRAEDLEDLIEFARFRDAIELRRFRGY